MSVAVWERRILAGEGAGAGSGDELTTSGASAEFMVIVRVWPSGLEIVRWAVGCAVVLSAVEVVEASGSSFEGSSWSFSSA